MRYPAAMAMVRRIAFFAAMACAARAESKGGDVAKMSNLFDQALESSGAAYLDAELELRRVANLGGADLEAIRKNLTRPDPIARLLARVIIDWTGPREADFKAAFAYLERVSVKFARTVIGYPPPEGVAAYLTHHFGDHLTDLLVLRLVMEPDWPGWKSAAILFYLKEHPTRTATAPLIRYAIETPDEEWRAFALEVVRAIKDPELAGKVGFEMARAKKLGRAVPPEVKALRD